MLIFRAKYIYVCMEISLNTGTEYRADFMLVYFSVYYLLIVIMMILMRMDFLKRRTKLAGKYKIKL